jgi:hypothetical protein
MIGECNVAPHAQSLLTNFGRLTEADTQGFPDSRTMGLFPSASYLLAAMFLRVPAVLFLTTHTLVGAVSQNTRQERFAVAKGRCISPPVRGQRESKDCGRSPPPHGDRCNLFSGSSCPIAACSQFTPSPDRCCTFFKILHNEHVEAVSIHRTIKCIALSLFTFSGRAVYCPAVREAHFRVSDVVHTRLYVGKAVDECMVGFRRGVGLST